MDVPREGSKAAHALALFPLKWYRWRKDGRALASYLLDSEVHTYAFSVAANAIISFIPFIVLLYTLARSVFRSTTMVPPSSSAFARYPRPHGSGGARR